MMNINETLAEYFEKNNPIRDYNTNINIPKFLREPDTQKKYELAQKLIKDILGEIGKDKLDSHITELYEVEEATMSLTGKRDHVIHALNTFLLGFYINNLFLAEKVDEFQWALAALCHDIAYPLEISQTIIERYLGKMRTIKNELQIENFVPAIYLIPKNFEKLTNNKNALECIQKRIYEWGLDVNVQKRYEDKISSNEICHGMLSALTVLYLVDLMYRKNSSWDQEKFEKDIVSACSAIFLHNLSDDAFEKIKKNKAPLPYLLKLCDELQTWDRPDQNTECLFSWNKVQGKDNGRFIEFLNQKLSIDWENTPKIENTADSKTINVTTCNNTISLKLIDENTNKYIEIDGERTDDFIAKSENGEINIYNAPDVDSPNNYNISIKNNRITFEVKSKWIRKKISKKIKCLGESNSVEYLTNFNNGTSE